MIARPLAIACAAGAVGCAVAVAALGTRSTGPTTTNASPSSARGPGAVPGEAVFGETAVKKVVKKKVVKKKKVVRKPSCVTTSRVSDKFAHATKPKPKKMAKPKPIPKPKPVACPAPASLPPATSTPPPDPTPPPAPPADVQIADSDGGVALHSLSGMRPGQVEDRCIGLSSSGGLSADVRLYLVGSAGPLAAHLDVTITPGTTTSSAFPDCAGFAATGADVFAGTLAQLAAHVDWTSGIPVPAPGNDRWQNGDAAVFRVRAALADTNDANGGGAGPLTAGPYDVVWEARDQ